MRILFMGTPDIAASCLRTMLDAGLDVAAVFTQPDRPKGRGMKLAASPVKQLALERGVAIYQPAKIRRCQPLFEEIQPELVVVAAYGRILPDWMLNWAKYGCINMHASLLPRWRGAAPIQRAVAAGDTLGGVTTMHVVSELDSGDIIFQATTPITEEDTYGSVYERYAKLGGELLVKTVRALEDGTAPRIVQDPSLVTFAPPVEKEEGRVDWTRPAAAIRDTIRGFNPAPVAFCMLGGENIKLYTARVGHGSGAPGEVISADPATGLEVAAGEGSVIITELQSPGKRRMDAGAWLRGHRIVPGTRLE